MAEALVIVVLQKITSALGAEGLKIIGSKLQKQVPHMQEVIHRMRLLQSDLSMMQAFISQVDARSSSDKLLETWLEQVRQAAHEAEDIVDEYIYLVGKMEGTNSFLKRALNQAAEVKRWRKLAAHARFVEDCLRKITETKNRFDVSADDSRRENALSYSSGLQHLSEHSYLNDDDDDFVGNKEEVKCLTGWLSDLRKDRTIISICGMGGLGKTTIASSIYKKEEIKRMFICRAWISVSQSYRVKDLLQKILLQLMAKSENIPDGLDTMDCVNLVELLRRYLKDRRYLIVLDDVWSRDSWPLLDSAFVKNDNGSRIIITTRIQAVASVADSNREMKLSLLPKEEAWTLFCQKAFSRLEDRSCPLSLKTCAERIVGKCQGLPLALVALGSLLSYKEMDEHEWELFYRQLRWQLSSNPELSWVASVLNLSYNDLPSYLKNCFLYCGLFPEDYQIERKQLIRLWIAEGFVEDRGPEVTLTDVAACYLKELTDRSLLQVVDRNEYGRPKRFQMHDLVREISLTISKKKKFATTWDYPNSDCNSDGSRRVSIQKDGILMPVKISAQLRSIIVFVEDISSSWFRDCYPSFRLLRVLSLRHCHIQKVPDNVSNLFNLHYLDLGYTLLKEIPRSIGKLSNLQTLYLKGSVLELPSEVTMLTKLQHLIIDVGRFGSSASNKICRQEHMQTLKYIEANSCVVRNLGCLTRMRSLGIRKVLESYNTDLWTSVSNMKALASLSVIAADRDKAILNLSDLKPLPYLEKLMLSGRLDKGAIPPPFGHFPRLKSLRLCFSGLHEDPLALLAVMFQNLGHLNLYRCYDGTKLTFRARWFPMLKHLYLSSMGELKEVEIEDGTLRTLRRLELWGLKSLTSVPEGLVHLKSLQQLCVGSMMPEEFKSRLEGHDRWIVEHIPYIGDP